MTVDDIAQVNWPESRLQAKYIQAYIGETPHLYFGNESDEHRKVLQRFLEEAELDFEYISQGGKSLPSPNGSNYRVAGMGFGIVNPDGQYALLGSSSYDYSMKTDAEHIRKIKAVYPDWDFRIDNEPI